MRFTFNDRSNPDDDSMGIQIVKVIDISADIFVHLNYFSPLENK